MTITIDGEEMEVKVLSNEDDVALLTILGSRLEYYVAESREKAGEAARTHWKDMAENDPKEFTCIVGAENILAWGMGHCAGPGSTQVSSLEDWLDLWLDTPEEHFASYDGEELDVDGCDEELEEELGFKPTVAYRHN